MELSRHHDAEPAPQRPRASRQCRALVLLPMPRVTIDAAGRVNIARQVNSPNCDSRPDPDDVCLIVVHGISLPPGSFGGTAIEAFFTNQLDVTADPYFATIAALRVSAC